MLKKLQLRKRLRVEGLESRDLLAGDVSVVVDAAGNLSIRGDLNDNLIEIVEVAVGEFEISNTDGVTPTTFNGGDPGPVTATGVVGNVSIDLKQGNDNLRVTGPATFPADVEVKTGFGNDFITFFTAPPDLITVAGDLSIKSGQGDDFLDLRRLAITGNAEIDTSDGADRVFFDDDSTVGGNLNVRLGHGNDTLGLGFIGTLSIGGHLQVNASLGDDTVNIDNTTGTTAEIDTSDGIDTVNITASTFTELTVRLGLGDDILSITDSTVTGTADLNGSSGIDTFNNLGVNVFGTLLTKKFEL